MIDRLVHHAEILALKGDSYRLKDRDLARPATPPPTDARAASAAPARPTGFAYAPPAANPIRGVTFRPALRGHFSRGLDIALRFTAVLCREDGDDIPT